MTNLLNGFPVTATDFDSAKVEGFKVYNAMSPNGDGDNDQFEVYFVDSNDEEWPSLDDYSLWVKIYNRNSTLIYEEKDYQSEIIDQRWNASASLNNGSTVTNGMYFYVVRMVDSEGDVFEKQTGFIVLSITE